MAVTKGSAGLAKIGSATIAEIKDWSLTETADIIDVTKLGDTAKAKIVGLTSASGSMNASWDESDTAGQGALTVGATVSLKLYPDANSYATMSAIINDVGVTTTADGVVETSFSFEVDGAVTWTNA
jgi:hypothetical protein